MKIKLAIIGEEDTLNKIKIVVEEFTETIIPYYFVYKNRDEVGNILIKCNDDTDVILFSGSDPYYYAENIEAINKPSVYIPREAICIYEVFWKIRDEGLNYKRVSIDAIKRKSVDEVLEELNINKENIYVKDYKPFVDYNELVSYHYELWKENKIDVAVTGIARAANKLKEMGVPAFRLYPTAPLIREYIYKAIYLGDVERIKSTQVAIQIVKIKNKLEDMSSEYEFLKMKNQFETNLIEYTQENFGAFFPFGRDEYLIFTTRGALKNSYENNKFDKIIELSRAEGISIASGIGFDKTLHKAELNARIALDYAMKETYSCSYILGGKGVITGPIGKDNGLHLLYNSFDNVTDIEEISKKIKISTAYISKIKAIINTSGDNVIDAEMLANYLGVSMRSSRRILNLILSADYAKVVGKRNDENVGRPKRLFEILF
jgi:hypothetical protein